MSKQDKKQAIADLRDRLDRLERNTGNSSSSSRSRGGRHNRNRQHRSSHQSLARKIMSDRDFSSCFKDPNAARKFASEYSDKGVTVFGVAMGSVAGPALLGAVSSTIDQIEHDNLTDPMTAWGVDIFSQDGFCVNSATYAYTKMAMLKANEKPGTVMSYFATEVHRAMKKSLKRHSSFINSKEDMDKMKPMIKQEDYDDDDDDDEEEESRDSGSDHLEGDFQELESSDDESPTADTKSKSKTKGKGKGKAKAKPKSVGKKRKPVKVINREKKRKKTPNKTPSKSKSGGPSTNLRSAAKK